MFQLRKINLCWEDSIVPLNVFLFIGTSPDLVGMKNWRLDTFIRNYGTIRFILQFTNSPAKRGNKTRET